MSFSNAHIVGSGITPADYLKQEVERGDPCYVLSRSDLVEVLRCPARWRKGYHGKDTDAKERGSLWDCLLLDRPAFGTRYAIVPETYPAPAHHPKVKKKEIQEGDPLPWNANAGWCETWLTDHERFETVKKDALDEAEEACARVLSDRELAMILDASHKQVMVVADWTDKATGSKVPLRALLDVVPHVETPFGGWCLDYKTTTSAEMRSWQGSVNKFNLDVQAALHLDLYVAASKEERLTFGHIVQESYAPYEVAKRMLSLEFLQRGRDTYRLGLATYCQCLKHDLWPGYPARTVIEGWQLTDLEAYMVGEPNRFDFPEVEQPVGKKPGPEHEYRD